MILSCSFGTASAEAVWTPVWTATGPIKADRYSASAVALPDGNALLIGGRPSGGQPAATVEHFNATTGKWSTTSSLTHARNSASAITLPDGRVLVTGGEPAPIQYHDTTEILDTRTGVWSAAARMQAPRADFATVLLADGRVLAVGGYHYDAADGAEIYDPAKDQWTLTSPPSVARANPAVARLRDGRVLVAGGWSYDDRYLDTAELYDPATDNWTPLPKMSEKRMHATAATLPDGRVIVVGGMYTQSGPYVSFTSRTSEVYDPATNTWSPPKPLDRPRGEGAALATLADGRPVITGGYTWEGSQYERSAEVYDPAADVWTPAGTMAAGRAGHVALRLADGSVLVTSGGGAGASSERLTFVHVPDPTPTATPTADVTPVATVAAMPSPAPTAQPQPGVATVAMAKRLKTSKAGALSLHVTCTGETACAARLTLAVRGGRTLARTTVALAAGQAKTVKLTLSRKERRRLAGRATKVTVTLAGTRQDATLQVR